MKKENYVLRVSVTRVMTAVLVITFLTGLTGNIASGQEGKDPVYEKVDKMPLFNGQEAGTFTSWIAKEVNYPDVDKKNKVMGKVVVNFVVEKDGTVSKVKVLKGVSPTIDSEVVRVIKSSPKWTPGELANKPVAVSMSVPIEFKLN